MEQRGRQPLSLSQKAARLCAGFVVAFGVVSAIAVWWWRDSTPRVTLEMLDAAINQWNAAGPSSYDLTIQLVGRREDIVHLRVRGGEPAFLTIGGAEIDNPRSLETWTVDSQFSYIEDDLESANSATNSEQIWMRAEFDPQTGIPLRYERTELGQPKTGWRLVELRTIAAGV